MAPDPERLGQRAAAMVGELGRISADPYRLERLFLTPEHRRAADRVSTWMREAGLAVEEDALGTVRGRLRPSAATGRPLVLLGSHLDTVIDAGAYDGAFGVIAGILALGQLSSAGRDPGYDIDILAFGDEEGSRFPVTMTSSAAVAGRFPDAALTGLDADGVSYGEALAAYGKDAARVAEAAYPPGSVAAYLELHIEQGPVLEAAERPLGIVTGIVGQSRLNLVLTGEAGHAGAVPMRLRRDALAGAAAIALALEDIARTDPQGGLVGTVGRIRVAPNATNVIPAEAAFSVDLRSIDDGRRREALARFLREAEAIAAHRRLSLSVEPTLECNATRCAPALQDGLEAALRAIGLDPLRLPSGAGHDAAVMAGLCPVAMLFVRCRGGISHNPAEYASPADMGVAVAALIRFLETFVPESAKHG